MCKNHHVRQMYQNNNQLQNHNQVKLDNCSIHRQVHPNKQHLNHNHLDQLHTEFQWCKNLLLNCSNNHKKIHSQVNSCNCQFHTCDFPYIVHHDHSLPHLHHKGCHQYNCQNCLKCHENIIFSYMKFRLCFTSNENVLTSYDKMLSCRIYIRIILQKQPIHLR